MINRPLINLLVTSLSIVTMLMGLVVMRGWLVQDTAVVQINPGYAPMQFNTALCFVLTSLALLLFGFNRRRLSATAAITTLLISGTSGLQYLLGTDLGLDTLFIDQPFTTTQTSHAGRMAPNTAFNFFIINLACLLSLSGQLGRTQVIAATCMASLALAVALSALMGYGTGLAEAELWGEFTRMALHTSVGFIMLGSALILLTILHSGLVYLHDIPWLPQIAAGATLTITILMYMALSSSTNLHLQTLVNKHDEDLVGDLRTYLDLEARAIKRMARRAQYMKASENWLWEYDGKAYLEDFSDLVGIARIQEGDNWYLVATDYREDPTLRARFMDASLINADPDELHFDVPEANRGTAPPYIRISMPIMGAEGKTGYVVALSRADWLFAALLETREYPDYVSQFYLGERLVYQETEISDPRWISQSPFNIGKLNADIVVHATPKMVRTWHNYLPTAFALVGGVMSLLVGIVLHLLSKSRRMSNELAVSNRELNDSLKEVEKKQQLLQVQAHALQRSNQDLENFASIASHDLNEPLRKISLFGERLLMHEGNNLDEKGAQYLNTIISGTHRMQALLNSLLAYSRVTTRGQPFTDTDLNKVLRDVQSDLAELISENDATIISDELPAVTADYDQMRQLFQNLIANAIRYRKDDLSPEIRISVAQPGNGKDLLTITVQDNGIGFDPGQAERIFEIFTRLHSRDKYPGTGMGLAVCKRIMERHEGNIHAEGEPGVGARFILTFSDPGQDKA